MNLSRPFIERPIATALLTLGLALAGVVSFFLLPVARLPAVDFPVITVSASLAGASPADMARSVATPLERTLGSIAGVNEMTSFSSTGSTRVTLQFDLERDIDSAAREVQAAINAARADLPATLRSNPTYRKRNPAAQPFLTLALTSATRTPGQIYDAMSNVVSQRLLQVPGVGDVELGGGSLPAVRVELNPFALHELGVSSEDVRAAIQANNANRPKGTVEVGGSTDGRALQVLTPAPGLRAADYQGLVVASRGGAQVRLSDVARVTDGVEDTRRRGMFNGQPAIIVNVTQQPGANLIETADAIDALLPSLRAQLPRDIALDVAIDRTGSIRASVREVELTLAIAVLLVVLVVGLFLRNLRAALIPAVATVVSLLGTFAVMYLLGYSLNNLTLMALTVATGFVVDDAIVVLENTTRHLERGEPRRQAALRGAREVGFTVLTISLSLVAVFIPLLFLGGQVGRMFREFAMTLSIAVMISLVISLTTTPMMCAVLLKAHRPGQERRGLAQRGRGAVARALERAQAGLQRGYGHALDGSLASPWTVLAVLAVVVALNVYLFGAIAKGFFPEQDNGQLVGGLRADQSISSTAMADKLQQAVNIIRADPAVATVVGFAGGGGGGGFLSAVLKPAGERRESTREVINRLRAPLGEMTGLRVFLGPAQELRMGGRGSNSTYQFTLKADNQADLKTWGKRLSDALKQDPRLTDVDDDQSDNAVETAIVVDRDRAAQLGVSTSALNGALYNAFGQRGVATMYADLNQYSVVMEWAPEYAQSPLVLRDLYVPAGRAGAAATAPGAAASDAPAAAATSANPALRSASTGQPLSGSASRMVPLSAFATVRERAVPSAVMHDGGELSSTLSFDLADGVSIEEGRRAVREAEATIGLPNNVRGVFSGAAAAAQQQQAQQWLLVLAAIVVIYIVLGILYESLIHPVTVLTTLPSAGFGAVVALMAMRMDFSIMALIGVFLLIGIVKKNAILIIDFALDAERSRGLTAVQAVREACLLRFRPILMTTLAAGLGALPLVVGFGQGAELRQPLGVTIVGGLIASQLLTLLTTPVVYVLLDRLRRRPAGEAKLARGMS
ncbi:efflux RND transporter permease subunit [Ottowia sp.]|uniref:efflux RND transporter permease subunit n=1 Tax=Ottowia sp. TaxID=1898956 RepID=UPI0025D69E25|nr:efflux RND transporter permease subunit [Ottowia sp.]MBK6613789.1 efflux RND transporter permease subunit [Ottowia sp.]MBK6748387.1 efflux RND transporter permease subunit [Ottowia sp.]